MEKSEHQFGGGWTERKLDILSKYLSAYTTIMKGNPGARHFHTTYVDAFAGTGEIGAKDALSEAPWFSEEEMVSIDLYKAGSARRALDTAPGFDHFVFVEKKRKFVEALESLKTDYPEQKDRIEIVHEDANPFLRRWCASLSGKSGRAVVFLDPYGMQVDWETIQSIGQSKCVDLWILFPVGAVLRLLKHDGKIPPAWADRLTKSFGNDSWRPAFFGSPAEEDLLAPLEGFRVTSERNASVKNVGEFFTGRLKTAFCGVCEEYATLSTDRGVPLYLFCFAASNPRGAKPALNIARDLLRDHGK